MKRKQLAQWWKLARPALSLAASAALMLVVLWGVDWTVLRASLEMLHFRVLAAAFALLLLNDFFLCVKCYLLKPELHSSGAAGNFRA